MPQPIHGSSDASYFMYMYNSVFDSDLLRAVCYVHVHSYPNNNNNVHAVLTGLLQLQEHAETIRLAHAQYEQDLSDKQQAKKQKSAIKNWTKLTKVLLSRAKLHAKYGH
jgi:hypothetical protein